MTAFMHDAAGASLPVAIGLLLLAATACATTFAQVADETKRLARQYLEPLSTWCLIALGVHTVAVGAAGEAGVGSLALPLALGAAAVLLRSAGAVPAHPTTAAEPTTSTPAAETAPDGALWADSSADEPTRRNGLWTRA